MIAMSNLLDGKQIDFTDKAINRLYIKNGVRKDYRFKNPPGAGRINVGSHHQRIH
jgi:hypothetical protein|tara:strand:+ start:111 stop:275 length:165 start_codon:yes stop_codon:yes gene_type:complete